MIKASVIFFFNQLFFVRKSRLEMHTQKTLGTKVSNSSKMILMTYAAEVSSLMNVWGRWQHVILILQSHVGLIQVLHTSFCDRLFKIFFFCFLGLHLWHMEVPRLGIKSELQLLAYTTAIATWDLSHVCDLSHICDLSHSSDQHWILNPLIEARDRTYILRY